MIFNPLIRPKGEINLDSETTSPGQWWLIAGVVAVAFLIRLWGISSGLPDAPDPDENMMVRRALRFASGDLNPHFFYYPSLSMYVFAFFDGIYFAFGRLMGIFKNPTDFALRFIRNPSHVYILARCLIALGDSMTAGVIYLFARRLTSQRAALLVATLWWFFPIALGKAQVAKPDCLMVLLATTAIFLAHESRDRRGLIWSGLVLGLSVSAKYNALLLGPPVAYLIWGREHNGFRFFQTCLIFGLFFLFGFLIGTPFAVLDYYHFWHDFLKQSIVMRMGPAGGEAGSLGYGYYLKVLFDPRRYGCLSALAVVGMTTLVRRGEPGRFFLPLVVVINFLVVGSYRIYGDHYLYVMFPFLFILAAVGWEEMNSYFKSRGINWLTFVLALAMFGPLVFYLIQHLSRVSRVDTRVMAHRWIMDHIPPGEVILMDASGPSLPMSREQLENLYHRAVEAGHVKADLFRLQLNADEGKGYHIYLTEQPVMFTPPDLLAYSRQVQDLLAIDQGLNSIQGKGVHYVVVSEAERAPTEGPHFRELYPKVSEFYRDLDSRAELLVNIKNKNPLRPGPEISIYRIGGAP